MFAVRLSTTVTLAAVLIIAACAASPQDGLSQGPTQSASPQDGLSQGPTPSAAPSASPRLAFAGVIAAPGDGGPAKTTEACGCGGCEAWEWQIPPSKRKTASAAGVKRTNLAVR